MANRLDPPFDCRITLRCLQTTFSGYRLPADRDFESLRSENSLIEHFFERRQNDPQGGEGGERISQIRSRPAFKLTSGRMRAATWFDRDHPPQGIVWLLGAEQHDERHKGRSDAYDVLGALDQSGELWPQEIDYERLELDRRRWDQEFFGADVQRDAAELVARIPGRAEGALAGVPTRIRTTESGSLLSVYVAVSTRPIPGPRSGLPIALTEERFALIQIAIAAALDAALGQPEFCEELRDRSVFPGPIRKDERAFGVLLERQESGDQGAP